MVGIRIMECERCGERHAVQSNGSMSIHTTKQGDRCAPPEPVCRRCGERHTVQQGATAYTTKRGELCVPPERTERGYGTGYDPGFRIVRGLVGGGSPGLGRRR